MAHFLTCVGPIELVDAAVISAMETLDSYSDRGSKLVIILQTCLLLSERNLSFQEASFHLLFFKKESCKRQKKRCKLYMS